MAKKKQDDSVSPDRELQEVVGGVTETLMKKSEKTVTDIEAKMSKLRGDKSAIMKEFEDGGGNKKAFKAALSISGMPEDAGRDYYRSLNEYLKYFGFFNQIDMFENHNGLDKTFKDEKVKVEKGKPAAPVAVGPAQADAVLAAVH